MSRAPMLIIALSFNLHHSFCTVLLINGDICTTNKYDGCPDASLCICTCVCARCRVLERASRAWIDHATKIAILGSSYSYARDYPARLAFLSIACLISFSLL